MGHLRRWRLEYLGFCILAVVVGSAVFLGKGNAVYMQQMQDVADTVNEQNGSHYTAESVQAGLQSLGSKYLKLAGDEAVRSGTRWGVWSEIIVIAIGAGWVRRRATQDWS